MTTLLGRMLLMANDVEITTGRVRTDRSVLTAEFDAFNRSYSYALAHRDNPDARNNELEQVLSYVGNIESQTVVEIGAGQGFLTKHLFDRVGQRGKVIAVDNSELQLSEMQKNLPYVHYFRASSENLPLDESSADMIVSLANFHHIADKVRAFNECARVLKPGGRLVLADVCNDTTMQKYFDEVVDKICSTGHQHDFLDYNQCAQLTRESGLSLQDWQLKLVPWQFPSSHSAGIFLQRIHDANCSADECWREASAKLSTSQGPNGKIHLHWQLFFMIAIKPLNSGEPSLTHRLRY